MRTSIFSAAAWAALILLAAPVDAAQRLVTTPADGRWNPTAPLPFFHHDPDDVERDPFPGFPGLKKFFKPSHPAPDSDGSLDGEHDRGTADAPPAAPSRPSTRAEALDRLMRGLAEMYPGMKRPFRPRRPAPGPDGSPDDQPAHGTAEVPPAKPPTRAEALDRLMGRLAKAQDPDEAKGIAALVQRMWMQSGSDTADLMMSRALTAMGGDRHDVAAALLDKVVELRPGWAEAWNKRATLRFLDGDDTGCMEDISHVLALEPRHFGALSGMGLVLARHGEDAAALRVLRRALSVYPGDAEVRKAADKLALTVEGQKL